MKIWPFDPYAEATDGFYISADDLRKALEPFRKIRAAVGSRMDIMVEFHSLWRLPAAQRIAQALAEFDTYWHEDPIRMNSLSLPEILAGRWSFKDLLEPKARRIAALADAWQLPVAPHDCTGPVVYVQRGVLAKPPGSGLGCELLPEVWRRPDAHVRVSAA
jgi:galactonate dehydratase